jgi:hypothetical protein
MSWKLMTFVLVLGVGLLMMTTQGIGEGSSVSDGNCFSAALDRAAVTICE